MNLRQAAASGTRFATKLEAKAQDIKSVDNNPVFDQDPRENFVSVETGGWSYTGQYDQSGKTLNFRGATLEKYEADGSDDVPAQEMTISSKDDGNKTYRQTELVTHPGCIEYFREDSTLAILADSGEVLEYSQDLYGSSNAFLS